MVIGTSAIVDTEIDGAVGMNSGIFNNPFMIWGKNQAPYRLRVKPDVWYGALKIEVGFVDRRAA